MSTDPKAVGDSTVEPISDERWRDHAAPVFWAAKAKEQHRAAHILWATMGDDDAVLQRELAAFYEDSEKVPSSSPPDLSSAFMLLAACAIENLLKGAVVGSDWLGFRSGKVKLPLTHDLLLLAKSAKVILTEDETIFCQMGAKAIREWGRYPIPSNPKEMTVRRVIRGSMFEVFDALFARLLPMVQIELKLDK